jgi:hypothetical protein
MSELRLGDRVCRSWPGCVDSVGVVTEIASIRTMFVQEPLVPGAIVKVESGPFWGQIVPFELAELRPATPASPRLPA